jgi:DNA-directed RNA polymerase subunit K/omega
MVGVAGSFPIIMERDEKMKTKLRYLRDVTNRPYGAIFGLINKETKTATIGWCVSHVLDYSKFSKDLASDIAANRAEQALASATDPTEKVSNSKVPFRALIEIDKFASKIVEKLGFAPENVKIVHGGKLVTREELAKDVVERIFSRDVTKFADFYRAPLVAAGIDVPARTEEEVLAGCKGCAGEDPACMFTVPDKPEQTIRHEPGQVKADEA